MVKNIYDIVLNEKEQKSLNIKWYFPELRLCKTYSHVKTEHPSLQNPLFSVMSVISNAGKEEGFPYF